MYNTIFYMYSIKVCIINVYEKHIVDTKIQIFINTYQLDHKV